MLQISQQLFQEDVRFDTQDFMLSFLCITFSARKTSMIWTVHSISVWIFIDLRDALTWWKVRHNSFRFSSSRFSTYLHVMACAIIWWIFHSASSVPKIWLARLKTHSCIIGFCDRDWTKSQMRMKHGIQDNIMNEK